MGRQEKTIHYIYKTTCKVTNRYYIGMHSTYNLEDGYMGSGKRLRYSIRKHGVDNHVKEILEFFESRELLIEGEKRAITSDMITDNNCMNLKGGGEGGFISLEGAKKGGRNSSIKHMYNLENDIEYRANHIKIFVERTKQLHKDGKIKYGGFTDKEHNDETKKLMSDKAQQRIGELNSQYGTCWITKEGVNKKIKKEQLNQYQQKNWVKGRK